MSKTRAPKKRGRKPDEEKKNAFALWWSLPKAKRVPKNLEDWMVENDVAHSTTWRWRQEPEFRKRVLLMRLELAEDSMTDVIQGLTDKAVDGELGQAKFLFELLGDYLPKSQIDHLVNGEGGGGLSPEMIEFAAEEMLSHPKMVNMSLQDLVEVMSDVLIEDE